MAVCRVISLENSESVSHWSRGQLYLLFSIMSPVGAKGGQVC